ncbi:MAG TPA: glycosyltransferase [archaeon]|nr:glycosyltransferase [archaeon]
MKVLHVGKFYWPVRGGIENHMKVLCEGLIKRGVSVRAVVSNKDGKLVREKINGVEVVRLPKIMSVFNQPIFVGLRKEIEDYGPDLIHIQLPNPLAALKIMDVKIPIIASYQSDIVGKPPVATQILDFYTKQLLQRSYRILPSSENYAKFSKMLMGFKNKITVVPLSVEIDKFRPIKKAKIKELRESLGISDEFIILFVGRLIPYKGVNFLLKALPMMSGNYKIIIVGDGPLMRPLKSLARELSADDRVIFFGEADDDTLPILYEMCDIFVLPSHMRSEAFGIVQMEAMVRRKPVVSCNIPGSGVQWVNKNGESGIVVEPENPKDLADAISRLMYSPVLRKKMGSGGRKRVEKYFDSQKMVKDILDIYKQAVKQRYC